MTQNMNPIQGDTQIVAESDQRDRYFYNKVKYFNTQHGAIKAQLSV